MAVILTIIDAIMDFLFFNDKSVIKQWYTYNFDVQLYVFMVKEYNGSAINLFVEQVHCHFLKAAHFRILLWSNFVVKMQL